ncbi:MAG TPA: response regulator [Steroidobacteraceae bacterium]|nr:response regulator [Steroidobacteraceae bacterium]
MTNAMHQVVIVEDEPGIRDVLRVLLTAANYRVVEADTAARGEIEARAHKPDVLLVDLGLPDRDGVELIRRIRGWSSVPIIVLSARTAEEQKIAALDAGADDYVTKPFGAPELLARVRAALRRGATGESRSATLQLGARVLDLARREVSGDPPVHLTPLEFRVLENLARHPGSIVKQDALIREVWGPGQVGDSRSLRVCIRNLRGKLEPDPARPTYIVTEAGLGYRLRPDEA